MSIQRVSILGATGSIGANTLDVIQRHPQSYEVFALAANVKAEAMAQLVKQHKPRYAVMRDADAARLLESLLSDSLSTEVLAGDEALDHIAGHSDVDIVVAAIVGAAGLSSTMSAVRAGKKVLLANKESLVMAGNVFVREVEQSGAQLLPVDSEHNAIFQCLPESCTKQGRSLSDAGIRRLMLTGSGGPFRTANLNELRAVTPQQACKHPNWSMGPKISVDSATMMNKGLEFIEACWLFNAQPDQIQIVVHPQSIIHSMVEYLDGSVLAQMGQPDMRTPIANCLAWPERIEAGVESLDFWRLGPLDFEPPDYQRFPCLRLATEAMTAGGTAPAALNAANELAVDAFLNERLAFSDIGTLVDQVMQSWQNSEPQSLDEVIVADQLARSLAETKIHRLANGA